MVRIGVSMNSYLTRGLDQLCVTIHSEESS